MADSRSLGPRPDVTSASRAELLHYIRSRRERAWLCTEGLIFSLVLLLVALVEWVPAMLDWLHMEADT